jgi:hypothetical protein
MPRNFFRLAAEHDAAAGDVLQCRELLGGPPGSRRASTITPMPTWIHSVTAPAAASTIMLSG